MPSVGVCYLDSNDCASEQEYRATGGREDVERIRGGREDERTRGRQENDRMGADVSAPLLTLQRNEDASV